MARDRLNQWAGQSYFNPTRVLQEAMRLGWRHVLGSRAVLPNNIPKAHRKVLIEDLDAAVFAHGLRKLFPDLDVCIAEYESQDHDFVLRFGPPDDPKYFPLQLKVVVPEEVGESQTPEGLLNKLSKYADASDLVVAIKIDRLGVDPRSLKIPPVRVAEIWFFGQAINDSSTWYLYGDCLSVPHWFQFHLSGAGS